jgi:type II secretory pathway component GspD/PulD (secretin)
LSAIWVAAPAAKMPEIIRHIATLDVFPDTTNGAVMFRLKYAPSSQVAAALNQFYNGAAGTGAGATAGAAGATGPATGRFNPPHLAGYNQIRITTDIRSNSVIVQASPGDLVEIRRLIEQLDSVGSGAKTDLRIVQLKNAVAADLGTLLSQAVGTGTLTAQSTLGLAPTVTTTNAGGVTTTQGANQIVNSKTSTVEFKSLNSKDGKPVQSDLMEDIRFNWDTRTNSIIVSAPAKTMPLILALIADLDVPPNARMEINIFTLKKSDAVQMAYTLQGLFLGSGGGVGGTQTTNAGATANAGPGLATGGAGAPRPIQITIQGTNPDGPPIIDLRLTVDQRTNSLIVAGSRNDLLVVGSIIGRIEDAKVADRCSQVVRLRNAQAVDVVNALTTYVTGVTTIYKTYNLGTNALEPAREVVMVAEPITNSIILDAVPQEFDKMLRIIAHLDTTPPQVVVSVLIAEVQLSGNEEFGCEIGLQSPIMFARSVLPGPGTLTYTTTAPTGTGFQVSGVSSTGTQVVAQNGNNFNLTGNPNASLPYGVNSPGMVGYQGLTNLGVGRSSNTSGIGGFVFSAQGSMVNVLLRALKTQERLVVLSRPNVQCLDKQAAVVVVGQNIPLNNGSNATATGVVSTAIIRQSVGVTLQVTPSITPDGRVMMRVIPEVTNVESTTFPIGPGVTGTSLGIQHLETTVNAEDGETVLLGGLISKSSDKNENKVPWLGDLAGIGSLFRFRTEQTTQTELIIIMTPHIVRNRQEGERVLAEDARRMSWELADVMRVHGNSNCASFMPPPPPPPAAATQPYRIIPGRQPNGMPGMLPQMQNGYPAPQMPNGYPGPQMPNGFQGPLPQVMQPGAQSNRTGQPAPMGAGVVNAADVPTAQSPASRIVPAIQGAVPSAPPANTNIGSGLRMPVAPAPGVLPPGVSAAPPTAMPIMLPQDLQSPGPPANVPWVMPSQMNTYEKK